MKTRKPGVSSGGGTIDEAELAEALEADPPDMDALQGVGGPGRDEWFVTGPVADNYREIWLSSRAHDARAKAKKVQSNAQAQENETNAEDLRNAATMAGRTPKKAGGSSTTPQKGDSPLQGDLDLSSINDMIKLRVQSARASLGSDPDAKRQKLEETTALQNVAICIRIPYVPKHRIQACCQCRFVTRSFASEGV